MLRCGKAHSVAPAPFLLNYPWSVSDGHEAGNHRMCPRETHVRRRCLGAVAHERCCYGRAPTKTTYTEICQEYAGRGQHRLQSSTASMEDNPLHQHVARGVRHHPADTVHTLQHTAQLKHEN